MKKVALHWQILISIALAIIVSFIFIQLGWGAFTKDYIAPFGTIFINLLKMVAVPLILISLIKGISNMESISKLSALGYRTVGLYLFTTFVAASVGLFLVNLFNPGSIIGSDFLNQLQQSFSSEKESKLLLADEKSMTGPLQFIVDMFSSNIFMSMSNQNMLQIISFAIFVGIATVSVGDKVSKPFKQLIESLNDIIIRIVRFIMYFAPYGVFALITDLLVGFGLQEKGDHSMFSLLTTLGGYALTVVLGLLLMIFLFYPLFLRLTIGFKSKRLFKGIAPALLTAISTSSSAATLPVTMRCCEKNLGIKKSTSSFILPLGATINMDGSCLYQAVAAVFIAQVYGIDLSILQQVGILFTATLASIGAAAIPSAGIITLIIILEQAGIPVAGIVLILVPDRLLDMLRTAVNVTGDCTICKIIDTKLK